MAIYRPVRGDCAAELTLFLDRKLLNLALVGGGGESKLIFRECVSVIHEDQLRRRGMGKEDTGGRVVFTMLGCGLWMGIE